MVIAIPLILLLICVHRFSVFKHSDTSILDTPSIESDDSEVTIDLDADTIDEAYRYEITNDVLDIHDAMCNISEVFFGNAYRCLSVWIANVNMGKLTIDVAYSDGTEQYFLFDPTHLSYPHLLYLTMSDSSVSSITIKVQSSAFTGDSVFYTFSSEDSPLKRLSANTVECTVSGVAEIYDKNGFVLETITITKDSQCIIDSAAFSYNLLEEIQ